MQSEFQASLVEFLAREEGEGGGLEALGGSGGQNNDDDEGDDIAIEGTIDFDDLSPELQREFQLIQVRSAEELAPLALERAVQMQRMVQAESYEERLIVLRDCVEAERRRLVAKKALRFALKNAGGGGNGDAAGGTRRPVRVSTRDARSMFERLMGEDKIEDDSSGLKEDDDVFGADSFQ